MITSLFGRSHPFFFIIIDQPYEHRHSFQRTFKPYSQDIPRRSSPALEQVSAERTGGVVRRGEPLVEAGRVELLLTRPTRQLGQLVVGPVQDVEADVALLHALEPLVHVPFPDSEAIQDGSVLVLEERGQLEHPVAPLGRADAHFAAALHLDGAQGEVAG